MYNHVLQNKVGSSDQVVNNKFSNHNTPEVKPYHSTDNVHQTASLKALPPVPLGIGLVNVATSKKGWTDSGQSYDVFNEAPVKHTRYNGAVGTPDRLNNYNPVDAIFNKNYDPFIATKTAAFVEVADPESSSGKKKKKRKKKKKWHDKVMRENETGELDDGNPDYEDVGHDETRRRKKRKKHKRHHRSDEVDDEEQTLGDLDDDINGLL